MNWVYEYVGSSPTFFNIVSFYQFSLSFLISRDRAVVARQAHNLKVVGSIPSPATDKEVAPQRNPCSPLKFISSDILIVSRALIIWRYCVNYHLII